MAGLSGSADGLTGSVIPSPVVEGDMVYCMSERLELIAKNRVDDPINASPALAGNQLFRRGREFLYCIEQ